MRISKHLCNIDCSKMVTESHLENHTLLWNCHHSIFCPCKTVLKGNRIYGGIVSGVVFLYISSHRKASSMQRTSLVFQCQQMENKWNN